MLALALVVGIVAGFGAITFYATCQAVSHYALDGVAGYRPHHPGGEPPLFEATGRPFRPWLLLLIPAIGGLLSGLLVFTLAPEAEGHGTDAAVAAFHYRQGHIRPRVPFVKLVASALTIGTGGSGGREGPIAQIGAGFGSFLGKQFHMRPVERRTLMAAGMGAGIAAIFRAPLAGALFAAEILYSSIDFEAEVILPAALASVAAYSTFGLVFGWAPLFTIPPDVMGTLGFSDPGQLLGYAILAVFVAVLAMMYTRSFYGLLHAFHRLRMPPHVRPCIGAFATGLVGVGLYYLLGRNGGVLGVLSFGYGSLQDAFSLYAQADAGLSLAFLLLAVALGKILTTGLTIGSGGSGGVFGPSMVIGGCGGGALGIVLHHFSPALVPYPLTFVVVGMAGFFAAAAKTPVSTLVIVSEMTGDYSLLLPTLWVCMISFLISDENSIYHSQVESRSLSPAHQGDYVREVLAGLSVKEFLVSQREVQVLRPGDRLPEIVDRLSACAYDGLPVADESGRYLGMVSLDDVRLASLTPSLGPFVVAMDLMRDDVPAIRPDDRLDRALELFAESDRLALAVVSPPPEERVLGVVRRADISSAYLRRVQGSTIPEQGSSSTDAS
jgi:CIC family chloride channel protein